MDDLSELYYLFKVAVYLLVAFHKLTLVLAVELHDVAHYLTADIAIYAQVEHNSNQVLSPAQRTKPSHVLLLELFTLSPYEIPLNEVNYCVVGLLIVREGFKLESSEERRVDAGK